MQRLSYHTFVALVVFCATFVCGCYYEGYWRQAKTLKTSNDLLELRALLVNEFAMLKHPAQEALLRRFSERCRAMVEKAERDMSDSNSAGEAGERRAAWGILTEESERILKEHRAKDQRLQAIQEMEVKAGTAVDLFLAEKGTLPPSFSDLQATVSTYGMGELSKFDPWHQPYQFIAGENPESPTIRLVSFGPDGAQGGDDDLEVTFSASRSAAKMNSN